MTYHRTRKAKVTGSSARGKSAAGMSPKISVSLPPEDMAVLVWWAGVKGVPAAQVLRDAVHSHLAPFKNNPALKKQYGSEPRTAGQ
jgi:hypothetical protein